MLQKCKVLFTWQIITLLLLLHYAHLFATYNLTDTFITNYNINYDKQHNTVLRQKKIH